MIGSLLDGIGKTFNKVVQFADNHPGATAILLNTAASVFSPDEIDVAKQTAEIQHNREDSERVRREGNLRVGSVDLPVRAKSRAQELLDAQGNPVYPVNIDESRRPDRRQGLIGRNLVVRQ